MKANPTMVVMAGILLVLFVANIITLAQIRDATLSQAAYERARAPRTPSRDKAPSMGSEDPRIGRILEEIASLRRETSVSGGGREGSIASPSSPVPLSPLPLATVAVSADPEVERVLLAQADFRRFWKEIEDVFDAKDKLDPEKYRSTVLEATADYLLLTEPSRSQFLREAEIAAADMAATRREYYESRDQLPPRDPANPSLYETQKDALSARYKEGRQKAAERVTRLLDPQSRRHQEFSHKVDKWLREMTP